jgi:hypothetical protein
MRSIVKYALVLGGLVVAALFLARGGNLNDAAVDLGVARSCTVGYAGAAVSVTIQGVDPDPQCDSWPRTDGHWYIYGGGAAPGGAVICQYRIRGFLVTVRDQGSLNLYGTQICRDLYVEASGS